MAEYDYIRENPDTAWEAFAKLGGSTVEEMNSAMTQNRQVPGNWNNQATRDWFRRIRDENFRRTPTPMMGFKDPSNETPDSGYVGPVSGSGGDYYTNAGVLAKTKDGMMVEGVMPDTVVNEHGFQEAASSFQGRWQQWRDTDKAMADRLRDDPTSSPTVANAVSKLRQNAIESGALRPSAQDMAAADLAEKKRISADQYNEFQENRFAKMMGNWRNRGQMMMLQERMSGMRAMAQQRMLNGWTHAYKLGMTMDAKDIPAMAPQLAQMLGISVDQATQRLIAGNNAALQQDNARKDREQRAKEFSLLTSVLRGGGSVVGEGGGPSPIALPKMGLTVAPRSNTPKPSSADQQADALAKSSPTNQIVKSLWDAMNPTRAVTNKEGKVVRVESVPQSEADRKAVAAGMKALQNKGWKIEATSGQDSKGNIVNRKLIYRVDDNGNVVKPITPRWWAHYVQQAEKDVPESDYNNRAEYLAAIREHARQEAVSGGFDPNELVEHDVDEPPKEQESKPGGGWWSGVEKTISDMGNARPPSPWIH